MDKDEVYLHSRDREEDRKVDLWCVQLCLYEFVYVPGKK